MTLSMLLRTFFEIIMLAFVVWGIFHEDRLAAAEKRFLCNLRRKKLKVVGSRRAPVEIECRY